VVPVTSVGKRKKKKAYKRELGGGGGQKTNKVKCCFTKRVQKRQTQIGGSNDRERGGRRRKKVKKGVVGFGFRSGGKGENPWGKTSKKREPRTGRDRLHMRRQLIRILGAHYFSRGWEKALLGKEKPP